MSASTGLRIFSATGPGGLRSPGTSWVMWRITEMSGLAARVDEGLWTTVVSFSGDLDSDTALWATACLTEELSSKPDVLIVDFAPLEWLTAAGVAVLVQASQAARTSGTALIIRHPRPQARRVLDICGLGGLIADTDDRVEGGDTDGHVPRADALTLASHPAGARRVSMAGVTATPPSLGRRHS